MFGHDVDGPCLRRATTTQANRVTWSEPFVGRCNEKWKNCLFPNKNKIFGVSESRKKVLIIFIETNVRR